MSHIFNTAAKNSSLSNIAELNKLNIFSGILWNYTNVSPRFESSRELFVIFWAVLEFRLCEN